MKKITLTPDQEAWLVANYADTYNADICKRLGLKLSTMHRLAAELGLKKSPELSWPTPRPRKCIPRKSQCLCWRTLYASSRMRAMWSLTHAQGAAAPWLQPPTSTAGHTALKSKRTFTKRQRPKSCRPFPKTCFQHYDTTRNRNASHVRTNRHKAQIQHQETTL